MWGVGVDAAVTEVVARWPYGDHSRLTAKDIEATACALVRPARRWSRGFRSHAAGVSFIRPARRVLESLRGAVFERADASVDARSVVCKSRGGFERLQRALDEHAAQRFATRLTGADPATHCRDGA